MYKCICTCVFVHVWHTSRPIYIKGNISIVFVNHWSIIQEPPSPLRVPGILKHMVSACVCSVRPYNTSVCVCVHSCVTSLWLMSVFFLSWWQISSDTQAVKGNKLLKVLFFFLNRTTLLFPAATSNGVHSRSQRKPTRWLSALRGTFHFLQARPRLHPCRRYLFGEVFW